MVATKSWIPAERIAEVVSVEPALVILGVSLASWLIYKIFLRKVSDERHRYLNEYFGSLLLQMSFTAFFSGVYWALSAQPEDNVFMERTIPYVGLLAIGFGVTTLTKAARILIYEYLIVLHMREGVPVLIVNLSTLVFGLLLTVWVATGVFGVNLAPLLATSAIFSIVLGLALQDTLGNLFAGISLQVDWKPYEIGDWIEVNHDGQKWLGQVEEISWRATTLLGVLNEKVTVPNRIMAQAQINSYAAKDRPLLRAQTYRFDHTVDPARVKTALKKAAQAVSMIRNTPEPIVLILETTESWVTYRLLYYIDDFGPQYFAGDAVATSVLETLEEEGLTLALNRLRVEKTDAA